MTHVLVCVRVDACAVTQVWDLLNGQNLHKLEPVSASEVTGVTCLHGNQLLTVGWSLRLVLYDIEGAQVRGAKTCMNAFIYTHVYIGASKRIYQRIMYKLIYECKCRSHVGTLVETHISTSSLKKHPHCVAFHLAWLHFFKINVFFDKLLWSFM